MKISVVIPTYNGEKFIAQQLRSIFSQTVKPDEIIVSDDGSTDNTVSCVEAYKEEAVKKGIDFIILRDNKNHGWMGNYENASMRASGDIIFNCDQDDVWREDKIQKIASIFENHPDAKFVFHDCLDIDSNGDLIKNKKSKRKYDGENVNSQTVRIDRVKYLRHTASTFLCSCMESCISKSALEVSLPFPRDTMVDQWEPFCSLLVGNIYYCNEPLSYYRTHSNNVSHGGGNFFEIFSRIIRLFKSTQFSITPYDCAIAMKDKLDEYGINDDELNSIVSSELELGKLKLLIANSNKKQAVFNYIKLCITSPWFRRSDTKLLIVYLWAIITGKIKK